MQTYFVILYGLNAAENFRLSRMRTEQATNTVSSNRLRWILPLFLLLTVATVYITYQTNQSMIVQSAMFEDVNADVVSKKTTDINDQLPSLTNVTMWGLPLSLMKARYLLNEKRIDEGIAMFENVKKENPYMYYAEFIKGRWYYENGYFDSAYKYGVIAFENRPRNVAYFGLLAFVCANKNDSGRLFRNFNLIRKYRNDEGMARGWNNYLYALTVMKYPDTYTVKVADSALAFLANVDPASDPCANNRGLSSHGRRKRISNSVYSQFTFSFVSSAFRRRRGLRSSRNTFDFRATLCTSFSELCCSAIYPN